MTHLNTVREDVEVPSYWERCEIHNCGKNPMQIYFLFDEARKTVIFEIKKDSRGNEYVSIKPLSETAPGRESYCEVFNMLGEIMPEAEVVFY